jgi:hypothetical protein
MTKKGSIMKNENKMKWLAVASLCLMFTNFAYAQEGGHTGNGGGGDVEFKAIRASVSEWIHKNQTQNLLENKLKLSSGSGAGFVSTFDQAVKDVGEKVVFNHDDLSFTDVAGLYHSRVCKNENNSITCNIDEWNDLNGGVRYVLVLHEYLGIANLEANVDEDYSQYPISYKLLSYVKYKESYELGMDTDKKIWEILCRGQKDQLSNVIVDFKLAGTNHYSGPNRMIVSYQSRQDYSISGAVTKDLSSQDLQWLTNDRYLTIGAPFVRYDITNVWNDNQAYFLDGIIDTGGGGRFHFC